MKKPLPRMKTDRSAKRLINQDLSEYISADNFTITSFEFAPKDKSITLRVSKTLLNAVQNAAKKRGINYQKLIREAIEQFLRKAA
jgi:predicted DNA binding CopG/RHH family protein